eukprot:scaffold117418_cov65-Phaeocystis_antarctica.AAC.6
MARLSVTAASVASSHRRRQPHHAAVIAGGRGAMGGNQIWRSAKRVRAGQQHDERAREHPDEVLGGTSSGQLVHERLGGGPVNLAGVRSAQP